MIVPTRAIASAMGHTTPLIWVYSEFIDPDQTEKVFERFNQGVASSDHAYTARDIRHRGNSNS